MSEEIFFSRIALLIRIKKNILAETLSERMWDKCS